MLGGNLEQLTTGNVIRNNMQGAFLVGESVLKHNKMLGGLGELLQAAEYEELAFQTLPTSGGELSAASGLDCHLTAGGMGAVIDRGVLATSQDAPIHRVASMCELWRGIGP